MNPILFWLIFVIAVEFIYYLFSKDNVLRKDGSEWGNAISIKFCSIMVAFLLFFIIKGIVWIFKHEYQTKRIMLDIWNIIIIPLLIVFAVIFVVVFYFWINKQVFSKVTKRETEKEYRERTKEETGWCKFKVGEKVIVKKSLEEYDEFSSKGYDYEVDEEMLEYLGRVVIIKTINKDGLIQIKEDNKTYDWCEDMFTKVKKKKGGKKR